MKRKKKKGFQELFGHTRRKLQERYNLVINEEDYYKIRRTIREGKATKIAAQSRARIVYSLMFMEQNLLVVYDRTRKLICTALPKDADREHHSWDRGGWNNRGV